MDDFDATYFSNWGPVDGPYLPDPREGPPFATFRLTVNKIDLPGFYVLDRRRFIPVDEWRRQP